MLNNKLQGTIYICNTINTTVYGIKIFKTKEKLSLIKKLSPPGLVSRRSTGLYLLNGQELVFEHEYAWGLRHVR